MKIESKRLLDRMRRGEFLLSVQIDPPTTELAFEHVIDELMNAGVSLVDINSSRRISHDSIHLATVLAEKGLGVIPHVTTRDSSINGLANQILAANSWSKVSNYLIITGDPYEAAQAIIPSSGVFQTDSVGAIEKLKAHLCGQLKLDLTFAGAVNQNGDPQTEGQRLLEKIQAGAEFFMSQPIFSEDQASKLLSFYRQYTDLPLLVGIWPLLNFKTVAAIKEGRIVGVVLPEEVYEKTKLYSDQADINALQKWSLKKTQELIKFVKKLGANGVYVVAPARNPLLLLDLLNSHKAIR